MESQIILTVFSSLRQFTLIFKIPLKMGLNIILEMGFKIISEMGFKIILEIGSKV